MTSHEIQADFMKRVLVIRFSSMGDVLLTSPVIKGILDGSRDIEVCLLTKKSFSAYFTNIQGLKIIAADTSGKHRGLLGLFNLYKEILRSFQPDIIVDLHGVIRSYFLSSLFILKGIPVKRIRKGRKEKRAYLKGSSKKELIHTIDRYSEVFRKSGINFGVVNNPLVNIDRKLIHQKNMGSFHIGISPFARHETKTWPIAYVMELMLILSKKGDFIFHFYGGKEDAERLSPLDFDHLNVLNHTGSLSPQEELESISGLDLFVSMDSANMHLADLLGLKVISIWGATHPDLGFRPFNQPGENSVQTEEDLRCRPCSVFGNKACKLTEAKYKCLVSVTPHMVAEKILSSLSF